ncbi:hypothetical protein Zmor_013590 [Zophobas morio]|uniref:Uncharacterized protein n=1 Tax=Zophobas morio TaxID=2755281 RepID=A0AA38IEB4_9CUCU|nr:hypothetical protein Zmor_013590 [Zophobas morio]
MMQLSVEGAKASVRKLLMSVPYSIVPYAVPIWGKAIEIKRNADRLRRLQRRMVLRVSVGYRTTSTDVLLVVAERPPMQLIVEERVRRVKKENRSVEEEVAESMESKQQREIDEETDTRCDTMVL